MLPSPSAPWQRVAGRGQRPSPLRCTGMRLQQVAGWLVAATSDAISERTADQLSGAAGVPGQVRPVYVRCRMLAGGPCIHARAICALRLPGDGNGGSEIFADRPVPKFSLLLLCFAIYPAILHCILPS